MAATVETIDFSDIFNYWPVAPEGPPPLSRPSKEWIRQELLSRAELYKRTQQRINNNNTTSTTTITPSQQHQNKGGNDAQDERGLSVGTSDIISSPLGSNNGVQPELRGLRDRSQPIQNGQDGGRFNKGPTRQEEIQQGLQQPHLGKPVPNPTHKQQPPPQQQQQQHQQYDNNKIDSRAENRYRAWASASPVPIPPQVADNAQQNGSFTDPDYYSLPRTEYRRLYEQVQDVRGQSQRRFRGSAFKKHFEAEGNKTGTNIYRSQLASSLKAFNNKKLWMAYEDPSKRYTRPQTERAKTAVDANESPVRCSHIGPRPRTAIPRGRSSLASARGGEETVEPRPVTAGTTRSDTQLLFVSPQMNNSKSAAATTTRPSAIAMRHSASAENFTNGSTSSTSSNSMPNTSSNSMPNTISVDNFDALTPTIAYELSGGQVPESVYGDRPSERSERSAAEAEHVAARVCGEGEGQLSRRSSQGSIVNGGGSDSELALSGEDDDDEEEIGGVLKKSGTHSRGATTGGGNNDDDDNSTTSGIETDKDSDDDSDDENIPEPNLAEVEMAKVPELNLRPEQVDNLNIMIYPKGDRRKYDFDIHNSVIPDYEFEDPLSQDTRDIDLLLVANSGNDWRDYAVKEPEDENECLVIDRLIELEKLRKQTIETEKVRREQARRERERAQARSRIGGARIQCSRVWREKRCCLDCLQVCCVGNCNEQKKYSDTMCFHCEEQHKTGSCTEKVYEIRSRTPAESASDEQNRPKTPSSSSSNRRPGSCPSCQRSNTAKYINANNVVLGRPKSGHATFARGQSSAKPKDLRPSTAVGTALEKEFETLGLEATKPHPPEQEPQPERPSTACSDRQRHYRGRVGVVPGKSYFSQRRMSLTDAATRDRIKSAGSVRKKRSVRSGKKRPKTAVS